MRIYKAIFLTLILAVSGNAAWSQKKPQKPKKAPPFTIQEGMANWPVDRKWQFAPGVPESMLDVVKPARMKRDPETRERKPSFSHPVLVWMPEEAEKIRAMIMIVANTDSKEFGQYKAVRDVCRKHGIAIVYMRFPLQNRMDDTQKFLDYLAKTLDVEEFSHAPWFTFGKSSMGKHAFYPWWHNPSRVIGSITYHGETPTWPMEDWTNLGDESILHVSANGETEWGGTYFVHVRPALLNYRKQTNVLAHQLIGKDIGHGDYPGVGPGDAWANEYPGEVTCYDTWEYLAKFIDKAMQLRVPEGYPTEKPFELKQVDPGKGLLIAQHAIEDIFQSRRHPLIQEDGVYKTVSGPESTVNGYSTMAAPKDYTPGEGVPVVALTPGMGPQDWLLVKRMRFAMKADPMVEPEAFLDLRPKLGDSITVDGKDFTWEAIKENERGTRKDGNGGITIIGDLKPQGWPPEMTILGYTALEVKEAGTYKVHAGNTPAVRVQLILNGDPIDNLEVVELEPGLYPLVLAIRMDGASWGHVEPHFSVASEEDIKLAQASQAQKEKDQAILDARFADGALPRESLIFPYDSVPEDERRNYLWMPDAELAEAWFHYHDVDRLRAEAGK